MGRISKQYLCLLAICLVAGLGLLIMGCGSAGTSGGSPGPAAGVSSDGGSGGGSSPGSPAVPGYQTPISHAQEAADAASRSQQQDMDPASQSGH